MAELSKFPDGGKLPPKTMYLAFVFSRIIKRARRIILFS